MAVFSCCTLSLFVGQSTQPPKASSTANPFDDTLPCLESAKARGAPVAVAHDSSVVLDSSVCVCEGGGCVCVCVCV